MTGLYGLDWDYEPEWLFDHDEEPGVIEQYAVTVYKLDQTTPPIDQTHNFYSEEKALEFARLRMSAGHRVSAKRRTFTEWKDIDL